MALKNKSMYAILGILNLSPCTGYDIKKYCDKVLSGFWNENYGHIYPTLKMLLTENMIELESEEETEKKICYRITAKGREELEVWLSEETSRQPVRSEFMLKLLFSSNRPESELVKMLSEYKEQHVQNISRYKEMQSKLENEKSDITPERIRFLKAVLRRGVISDEATIRWCNEAIEEMSSSK